MIVRSLIGLVAVVGTAMPALGQIVPPKREDPQPAQPVPAQTPSQPQDRPRLADPPKRIADIDFEPIFKFDQNGKVIEVKQCIDYAALRHNPLITTEDWEKLNPALDRWQRTLDQTIVDNIDLIQEIEANALVIDLQQHDPQKIQQLQIIALALSGGNQLELSTWLQQEGVITGEQQAKNRQITTGYKQALSKQWNDDLAFDPAGAEARQLAQLEFTRKQFMLSLHDQTRSIRRMLTEASMRVDELTAGIDLDDEQHTAFRAVADLAPNEDPDIRYQMMGNAFWSLKREQQQAILNRLLQSAPPKFDTGPAA